MDGPRINTIDKDKERFDAERQKLLMEMQLFKLGQPAKGLVSLDLLESMYQVLLYSYHVKNKETKPTPEEYIYELSKLRADLLSFTIAHSDQKTDPPDRIINYSEYKRFINRFNDLVYMLYEIKANIGMS